MSDDTSDKNITKLFEINTRIDERMKSIQNKQCDLERALSNMYKEHNKGLQRIAVLESIGIHLDNALKSIGELDKRIVTMEISTNKSQDRWRQAFTFIIQLVWVLLASWLLVKLNLQSPSVP